MYSSFDTTLLSRLFFHCSKQFLNLSLLMPFRFLFHLFHIGKMFLFQDFFHPWKQTKKSLSGWDQVNREGGTWGSCLFGQKLLNTQRGVGNCAGRLPIMKWANASKVFKKYSLKPNAASHNNARWFTDTDGFREHSPSRGSPYYKGLTLWKTILGFWGPPHNSPRRRVIAGKGARGKGYKDFEHL